MSDVLFAGNAPVHTVITSPYFCAYGTGERRGEARPPNPKRIQVSPEWISTNQAQDDYKIYWQQIRNGVKCGAIRSRVDGVYRLLAVEDVQAWAAMTPEERRKCYDQHRA